MIPLMVAPTGEPLRVLKIATDEKTKKHLESLGITVNSCLKLAYGGGGSVIAVVKDVRLALNKEIALKIFVA